ncbi:hypothetical protein AOC05_00650 [Arthrobacter alpinus]|uniref:Uncharacterized protein n=1 Tax=Arthrobacter alpinus TaxID=656366 RepID=A0A0M4RM73_9MICC|nr:hypothetical protein AOC05_00650 [Arthrobacter alpinus]
MPRRIALRKDRGNSPAVASILQFDLSKPVPGLWRCGECLTTNGTEEAAVVAQFNEFLMSRLHPTYVSAIGCHGQDHWPPRRCSRRSCSPAMRTWKPPDRRRLAARRGLRRRRVRWQIRSNLMTTYAPPLRFVQCFQGRSFRFRDHQIPAQESHRVLNVAFFVP